MKNQVKKEIQAYMKRFLVLLLAMVMLLSACGTTPPNNIEPSDEVNNTVLDDQNGTTATTNGTTATTEGSGETSSTETTGDSSTGTVPPTTEPTAEPTTKPTTEPPTEQTTPPTESTPPSTEAPTEPPTENTEPEDYILKISQSSLSLEVGQVGNLTAEYTGTGTLTWKSSDTSKATVSNGKVTAKAAGSAVVTVSDGNKSATCSITVTAPASAKTFTFNTQNNTTITAGNTFQIDYSYSGSNAELTWSSTDSSVLTVNNSGVVTAKAKGAATIKVTNGEKTWRLSIRVDEVKPAVTSFYYSNQNAPLYDGITKYAGDYMSFQVSTRPYESNRNINVTSSNSGVVSVSYDMDSTTAYVTLNFKSSGTATVTIASADGAYSQSYTITVKSDYGCNPGGGLLTPEQVVNAYNGVVSANGMSTSGMPTGYLVWTVSPNELTWSKVRREAEGGFHSWWKIGYRTMVLTYEGTDENGNYIFYERGA